MLDNKEELYKYINTTLTPETDKKLQYGEVFTPMDFVEHMLDLLEQHNPSIFSHSEYRWLDPSNGIGNFPIAIYYRLMKGLTTIKDIEERKRHILENMLFVCEINDHNNTIYKDIFDSDNYNLNIYEGDFFDFDPNEEFNIDKFDIVLGNPPYQKPGKGNGICGSSPIYNKFIEKSLDISNTSLFITPSRWFSGGKGLESFRKKMLNREDIPFIKHYRDSKDVFSHVNISGGVSIICIDKNYKGNCKFIDNDITTMITLNKFDVISDPQYISLIERFIDIPSLESIAKTRNLYSIETNGYKLDKTTKKKYNIFLDNQTDTTVICHTSQKYDYIKYIEKKEIKKDNLEYWKVITGKTGNKKNFGRTLICKPQEVHSNSYFSFTVQSEAEAESLISYMKCKLPRIMLGLRKITQDISPEKCKWIPLIPLDRHWTDKKVEEYFNLSDNLKRLIRQYCEEYKINDKEESKKESKEKVIEIIFEEVNCIDENGVEKTLTENDLCKYTISKLKDIAKFNNVSIKGLKTKKDIILKIMTLADIKME